MFLTINAIRPKPSDDAELRFLETPAGKPAAVKTWWYPGDTIGREFIYPKSQAKRLAAATNTTVLTTKADAETVSTTQQVAAADLEYVSPSGQESAVTDEMLNAVNNAAPTGGTAAMNNRPVQESTSASNMKQRCGSPPASPAHQHRAAVACPDGPVIAGWRRVASLQALGLGRRVPTGPPTRTPRPLNPALGRPQCAYCLPLPSFSPLWPGACMLREQIFHQNLEWWLLHVAVRDGKGYVSGLEQKAFRVLENKQPQPVSFFSNQDTPVTVGLVIDSSGSMGANRDRVIAAAVAFAENSNPDDDIFALAFNENVRSALPRMRRLRATFVTLRSALVQDHRRERAERRVQTPSMPA
jgi:hypothetical protein